MDHILGLQCTVCGETYSQEDVEYVCPKHGDDGNLDVLYDYDLIAKNWERDQRTNEQGMWRYRALLPVNEADEVPPLHVGDTPLYPSKLLADQLGLREVWIKDDGRNPTGSFKDRASALVVTRAVAEKRELVTTASTGNAGAALAGLAASMHLPTVIFAPASAPEAKVAQLLVYGSHVFLVDGTYDDAFELCLQATRKYGWYCRNTGYNPYTAEGKKTVSYEICEQLAGQKGKFHAPDRILVSVGDGNIISGIHKGLRDLLSLGWIDQMPKLVGMQAEGSAAMYQAWKENLDPLTMPSINAHTIADSISAGLPRDRVKAMNAIRQTGGFFMTVSDESILAAIPQLARATGVFAEPAAAATYAGLTQAVADGLIGSDEQVVLVITGSGLKDVAAAKRSVPKAHQINADLQSVENAVSQIFAQ
jgi:threonine synthase